MYPLRSLIFATLLFSFVSQAIGQQVIFNDDFSVQPSANGWTESTAFTGTANPGISTNGSQAILEKVSGGSGRAETRITRTIDTTGFENIEIELVAFQSDTNFEGGAFLNNNTDSLSVYVDIGAGFAPLFQRTGAWGAGGVGFSDGGTGRTIVPTSSGFLLIDPAAANNPNLRIQIEGIVSAGPEDYFVDDFTLRGTAIPQVLSVSVVSVARKEDPILLITDENAIQSLLTSGVPVVSALKDVHFSAIRSSGRDINERLFRLRSGLGIGEFGHVSESPDPIVANTGVNSIIGGMAPLPKEIAVQPQTTGFRFKGFATGDFGRTDQNPIDDLAAFEGDTISSSVGIEFASDSNWAAGLAWTYLESDNEFAGNLGSADLTGNTVSAYGTWLPTADSYLSLRYGYTDLESDIARNTGLGTTAFGAPDASAHTLDLDGGYHFRFGAKSRQLVTGPIFGIDYTSGEIDEFSEFGATRGAIDAASQVYESLVTRLGWQVSKRFELGGATVTPQLRLAWEHEAETADEETDVQLQQSPFLFVRGDRVLGRGGDFGAVANQGNPGRDYLSAGSGVRVVFSDNVSLALDYEGHFFRENRTSHFGGVRLSVGF